MMTGPNLEALEDILSRIKVNLIASGGISSLEHIRALKRLRPRGIEGAIIGKALYAGALNLAEAIKAAS